MAQTDEGFILLKTGEKSLSDVKTLDLSNLGLAELDAKLMQKLENLETLTLAQNQIEIIPEDIALAKLKKLDVSENKLSTLDFITQFPALQELYVEGNGLDPSDKYIASLKCPHIHTIDKTRCASLTAMVHTFKSKIEPEVREVWETQFMEKRQSSYRMPEAMTSKLVQEIVDKVQDRKLYGSSSLKKFRDYLVHQLCQDLIDQVRAGEYEPCAKKPKLSVTPPPKAAPAASKKPQAQSKSASKKIAGRLPVYNDYDPVHFLRCHFCDREALRKGHKQNDPTDATTKIWCCQFEPNPIKDGETTGVVATCGGDTVSLIDCSTGRLMKRYQQAKEQFYSLAWTTLNINGKPTNILAVGGHIGHIKLLHPEQLLCYKQLGSGRPNRSCHLYYLSCLLFHPTNKTWLFTGASDTTITLWDIGVPSGEKYDSNAKILTVLSVTEGSGILNMVFHDSYLLAGCETSCFVFNIDSESNKQRNREPDMELVLPGGNEAQVDGLVKVGKDLIASKCAKENTIHLWRLGSFLPSKKHTAKVEPLVTLEWCQTQIDYINIGANSGLLISGDDRGNVWMYNVEDFVTGATVCKEILKPSRILPWPNCELDEKENSQKMTDILDLPQEIVINCSAVSSSKEFLVVGTDNNLVCVWQRCK